MHARLSLAKEPFHNLYNFQLKLEGGNGKDHGALVSPHPPPLGKDPGSFLVMEI